MKKTLLLIAICIATIRLTAQETDHHMYSLQYSIGYGTGDLGDFIGKPGFRGFCFDYRRTFATNVYAGFDLGWNVFYEEKGYDTYTEGTLSISGTQFRYLSSFPMLVDIGYNFQPSEKFAPYIGLGIGTIYNYTRMDVGIYQFTNDGWHFALKGELGFVYHVSPDLGIIINGKYYNGFETSETINITYITSNIGFAWVY